MNNVCGHYRTDRTNICYNRTMMNDEYIRERMIFHCFFFLVNAYCLHLVFEAVVWSSSGLFMVIPYSVIAYIFIDCGECEIKHDHLLWDTPTSSRMKLLLPFSKRINYIKSESNVFKFLNVNSANNRSANSRFDSNSIVLSNLNHRIR